jgi:hypothetical protein
MMPWRLKANNALTQRLKSLPMIFLGLPASSAAAPDYSTHATVSLRTGCKVVAIAEDHLRFRHVSERGTAHTATFLPLHTLVTFGTS